MINGGHVIIYSKNAEADKAFIKNVLKFPYVDVNQGWLIFKLPPAEIAVHPSDENDLHVPDDGRLGARDQELEEGRRQLRRGLTAKLGAIDARPVTRRRNAGSLPAAASTAVSDVPR